MKIRKNAEQRNFIVNKDMYNLFELYNLCENGYIVCHQADGYNYVLLEKPIHSQADIADTDIFRIYAANCKTVKVVYNPLYGFYENVVETKDGTQISIVL